MKKEIHPEYSDVTIQCACGTTYTTKSTLKGVVQVDICSACHPFFTGKQKLMDTAGRIDRLKKKFGTKVALGSTKGQKTAGQPIKSMRDRLREAAQQSAEKEKAEKKEEKA